jgi:hypothetical protein
MSIGSMAKYLALFDESIAATAGREANFVDGRPVLL